MKRNVPARSIPPITPTHRGLLRAIPHHRLCYTKGVQMKTEFCFCSDCGVCCKGHPVLSNEELRLIEAELGRELRVMGNGLISCPVPGVASNYLHGEDLVDGYCQFHSDLGCILENRPSVCGTYPFWKSHNGWHISTACPNWDKVTKEDLMKAMA
jgi:Fe-S-cluster containining protein